MKTRMTRSNDKAEDKQKAGYVFMPYRVSLRLKCATVILSVYTMINCFLLFIYAVRMDCLVPFAWKNAPILLTARTVKRYVNVTSKPVITKKDVQVYTIIN